MTTEWLIKKKPSVLGLVSGAVSGLVVVTPGEASGAARGRAAPLCCATVACVLAHPPPQRHPN